MKTITLASLIILSAVGICGTSDEECIPKSWYQDADGDGFGNPKVSLESCEAPLEYVENAEDPDDENKEIFPGSEVTNPGVESCQELTEHVGDVRLQSQTDVDAFGKKCIGKIKGTLVIIESPDIIGDPIKDLSPLAGITEISGGIFIGSNQELKSLEGLHSLRAIYSNLSIYYNPLLEDLKGLRNLELIADGLEITDNLALISLEGLEKIKTSSSRLIISRNPHLQSLKGLDNLEHIEYLWIGDIPKLENLKELKSIKSIEGIGIYQNERLSGFFNESQKPTSLRYVKIEKNPSLVSLKGLAAESSHFDGYILVKENKNLRSLEGLYPNHTISGEIEIEDNENLTDIKSLAPVVEVDRNLHIINNDQLTNLDGLENVRSAGKTYPYIPSSPTFSLQIFANDRLADLCAIKGLLATGYAPIVHIVTNKYNPSTEDIISGRCRE